MKRMFNFLSNCWNYLLISVGLRKKLSFREKLPKEAREHFDAIWSMFRSFPSDKFERESSFREPLRSNLWIVEIEKVDSFMVASVALPTISIVEKKGKASLDYGNVYISFYERVENPIVEDLIKLLDGKSRFMTIKTVNQLGKVTEEWKLSVKPVQLHPIANLDYENSNPFKWQLECECLKWEIKFSSDQQESEEISSNN